MSRFKSCRGFRTRAKSRGARSERAYYWYSCRSSSRVYHATREQLWVPLWNCLTPMTHCRSFCRRQDHRRSVYSWCKVQSFWCSSRMIHICRSHVIGSTYHPSQLACDRSQFHLHHHRGSVMTHQCRFPDHHLNLIEDSWCGSVSPDRANFVPTTIFIGDECFKLDRIMGNRPLQIYDFCLN